MVLLSALPAKLSTIDKTFCSLLLWRHMWGTYMYSGCSFVRKKIASFELIQGNWFARLTKRQGKQIPHVPLYWWVVLDADKWQFYNLQCPLFVFIKYHFSLTYYYTVKHNSHSFGISLVFFLSCYLYIM